MFTYWLYGKKDTLKVDEIKKFKQFCIVPESFILLDKANSNGLFCFKTVLLNLTFDKHHVITVNINLCPNSLFPWNLEGCLK